MESSPGEKSLHEEIAIRKMVIQSKESITEDGAFVFAAKKVWKKQYGVDDTNQTLAVLYEKYKTSKKKSNKGSARALRSLKSKYRKLKRRREKLMHEVGLELLMASDSAERSGFSGKLAQRYGVTGERCRFSGTAYFLPEGRDESVDKEDLSDFPSVTVKARRTFSEGSTEFEWQGPPISVPARGTILIFASDSGKGWYRKKAWRAVGYDFAYRHEEQSSRRVCKIDFVDPIKRSSFLENGLPMARMALAIAKPGKLPRGACPTTFDLEGLVLYLESGTQSFKSLSWNTTQKMVHSSHPKAFVAPPASQNYIGAPITAEATEKAILETSNAAPPSDSASQGKGGGGGGVGSGEAKEGALEEEGEEEDKPRSVTDLNDSQKKALASSLKSELKPLISVQKGELVTEFRLVDTTGSRVFEHSASSEEEGEGEGGSKNGGIKKKKKKTRFHFHTLARALMASLVLKHVIKIDGKNRYTDGVLTDGDYLSQFFRERDPPLHAAISQIYKDSTKKFPSLHDLLSERSGLPEYLPVDIELAVRQMIDSETDKPEIKSLARHLSGPCVELSTTPGAFNRPSSVAYAIVGAYVVLAYANKKKYQEVYERVRKAAEDSEDPKLSPSDAEGGALYAIIEHFAHKLGMKTASYSGEDENTADSEVQRIPGNPGLFAGDTGLYGTADDLAAFLTAYLDSKAKAYLKTLLVPVSSVSAMVPIQVGLGGWKIDQYHCNPETVLMLSDDEPLGHSYRVFLYPSRGTGFVSVGNIQQNVPSHEFGALLHARVLRAVRSSVRCPLIDRMIPKNSFCASHENRLRYSCDVPLGYMKVMGQYRDDCQDDAQLLEAVAKRNSFISEFGGASRTYYSLLGQDGKVESIQFFYNQEGSRLVIILKNQDPTNIRYATFRRGSNCLRIIDPVHYYPADPVRVLKLNKPFPCVAIEMEGTVYVDLNLHEHIENKHRSQIDSLKRTIDARLVGVVDTSQPSPSSHGTESSGTGASSSSSPHPSPSPNIGSALLSGLVLGGLAVAAFRPRPVYYAPAPAWAYPAPIHDPYWRRPVYIGVNPREKDSHTKHYADSLEKSIVEQDQALANYPEHREELEEIASSSSASSIGRRAGGGGGGGGGRSSSYRSSSSSSRGYVSGKGTNYRPVSQGYYRHRPWSNKFRRHYLNQDPRHHHHHYQHGNRDYRTSGFLSGAGLWAAPWTVPYPPPETYSVGGTWYEDDYPYAYNDSDTLVVNP